MTIATMQFLDAWLGALLCFALGHGIRLKELLLGRRPPHDRFDRVLLIKLFGLGSVTLTTPTAAAIRDKYPRARVDLLTFSSNRVLAQALGCYDRVWTLDTKSFAVFAAGLFVLLRDVRRERYDAVLDLEFFSYFSHLLGFLFGIPRRVGFISPLRWRGLLSTDGVFFNHYRHITQVFLTQAHILGCAGDSSRLAQVTPPEAARARVRAALSERGVPAGGTRIAVNVNASDMCLERRWPAASFVELVRRLRARHADWSFLFVGGPEDVPYVKQVLAAFPKDEAAGLLDVCGAFDIVEFMALLQSCTLLVSNDSGPVHIAQLVGLPTLSFSGPAPPSLFRPLGPQNRVLYAGVWCSPCLNYYTLVGPICHGDNICMKQISVEQALAALEEHLGQLGGRLPPLR